MDPPREAPRLPFPRPPPPPMPVTPRVGLREAAEVATAKGGKGAAEQNLFRPFTSIRLKELRAHKELNGSVGVVLPRSLLAQEYPGAVAIRLELSRDVAVSPLCIEMLKPEDATANERRHLNALSNQMRRELASAAKSLARPGPKAFEAGDAAPLLAAQTAATPETGKAVAAQTPKKAASTAVAVAVPLPLPMMAAVARPAKALVAAGPPPKKAASTAGALAAVAPPAKTSTAAVPPKAAKAGGPSKLGGPPTRAAPPAPASASSNPPASSNMRRKRSRE